MDNNSGFRRLILEIILSSIRDYKKFYLKYLEICTSDFMGNAKHKLRLTSCKAELIDVEEFFNSEWFMFLTDADPVILLKETKTKTENDFKRKARWRLKRERKNI